MSINIERSSILSSDAARENENFPTQKPLTANKTPSISSIQENTQEKVGMGINKNLNSITPQTGPDTVTVKMEHSEDRVHPHLGEDFTDPINQIFNPKEINKGSEDAILDGIKDILKDFKEGDKEAEIDFTKLGLSSKTIKKNQIEGKVWIDDNGKFQVKVTGYLGDDFKTAFSELKNKVGDAAKNNNLQNPITLDPNIIKEPSEDDWQVMQRGGQIQYRALDGNNPPKTLKLTLDPGKDGQDDGLTVSVLASDNKDNTFQINVLPKKIPLSVVFEGQELNGKKTDHPLLEGWRERKYFERAEIKSEWFFSNKTDDNTNSVGRTQAQNDLWNAVNKYLQWSVAENKAMGFIDTSEINEKNQQAINDNSNEQVKEHSKIQAMLKKVKPKKNNDKYKDLLEGVKTMQKEINKILENEGNDKNENLMKELDALVQNPEDFSNLDKLIQDLDELSQNPKNIKVEAHVKTKLAKSNIRHELINKAKELSNTVSKLTQQLRNDLDNSNVESLGIPEGNTERLRQFHEGEIEKNR